MLWPFGKGRSSAGVKGTDRHGHGLLNSQRSSYLQFVSFIPGRANASRSNTQGGSPVREIRPPGSVRGVLSNEHSYRDRTERPQLVSSVTRITSTLRACANARTFLRSARSCFAPEAISFQTPHDFVASLLGEGA